MAELLGDGYRVTVDLIFSHQALPVEETAGGSPRGTSVEIFSQHHLDHSTTILIPMYLSLLIYLRYYNLQKE
jgi:hypothetical protein